MTGYGARAVRRGLARPWAVCAVLFGLFLMHGSPTAAAEGCHGGMPAMAAAAQPLTASSMAAAAQPMSAIRRAASAMAALRRAAVSTADAPDAHRSRPAVRVADASGMPGQLCVSTPAHERTRLPAPGLIAVAGAGAFALWGAARVRAAADGAGRRRGPPVGGRDLLLQVCTART